MLNRGERVSGIRVISVGVLACALLSLVELYLLVTLVCRAVCSACFLPRAGDTLRSGDSWDFVATFSIKFESVLALHHLLPTTP